MLRLRGFVTFLTALSCVCGALPTTPEEFNGFQLAELGSKNLADFQYPDAESLAHLSDEANLVEVGKRAEAPWTYGTLYLTTEGLTFTVTTWTVITWHWETFGATTFTRTVTIPYTVTSESVRTSVISGQTVLYTDTLTSTSYKTTETASLSTPPPRKTQGTGMHTLPSNLTSLTTQRPPAPTSSSPITSQAPSTAPLSTSTVMASSAFSGPRPASSSTFFSTKAPTPSERSSARMSMGSSQRSSSLPSNAGSSSTFAVAESSKMSSPALSSSSSLTVRPTSKASIPVSSVQSSSSAKGSSRRGSSLPSNAGSSSTFAVAESSKMSSSHLSRPTSKAFSPVSSVQSSSSVRGSSRRGSSLPSNAGSSSTFAVAKSSKMSSPASSSSSLTVRPTSKASSPISSVQSSSVRLSSSALPTPGVSLPITRFQSSEQSISASHQTQLHSSRISSSVSSLTSGGLSLRSRSTHLGSVSSRNYSSSPSSMSSVHWSSASSSVVHPISLSLTIESHAPASSLATSNQSISLRATSLSTQVSSAESTKLPFKSSASRSPDSSSSKPSSIHSTGSVTYSKHTERSRRGASSSAAPLVSRNVTRSSSARLQPSFTELRSIQTPSQTSLSGLSSSKRSDRATSPPTTFPAASKAQSTVTLSSRDSRSVPFASFGNSSSLRVAVSSSSSVSLVTQPSVVSQTTSLVTTIVGTPSGSSLGTQTYESSSLRSSFSPIPSSALVTVQVSKSGPLVVSLGSTRHSNSEGTASNTIISTPTSLSIPSSSWAMSNHSSTITTSSHFASHVETSVVSGNHRSLRTHSAVESILRSSSSPGDRNSGSFLTNSVSNPAPTSSGGDSSRSEPFSLITTETVTIPARSLTTLTTLGTTVTVENSTTLTIPCTKTGSSSPVPGIAASSSTTGSASSLASSESTLVASTNSGTTTEGSALSPRTTPTSADSSSLRLEGPAPSASTSASSISGVLSETSTQHHNIRTTTISIGSPTALTTLGTTITVQNPTTLTIPCTTNDSGSWQVATRPTDVPNDSNTADIQATARSSLPHAEGTAPSASESATSGVSSETLSQYNSLRTITLSVGSSTALTTLGTTITAPYPTTLTIPCTTNDSGSLQVVTRPTYVPSGSNPVDVPSATAFSTATALSPGHHSESEASGARASAPTSPSVPDASATGSDNPLSDGAYAHASTTASNIAPHISSSTHESEVTSPGGGMTRVAATSAATSARIVAGPSSMTDTMSSESRVDSSNEAPTTIASGGSSVQGSAVSPTTTSPGLFSAGSGSPKGPSAPIPNHGKKHAASLLVVMLSMFSPLL